MKTAYNDVKVYQINLDFYEFKSFKKDITSVVKYIITYHKEHFETSYQLTFTEERYQIESCAFRLYTFNELEKESYWKQFLPKELIGDRDFTLKSTSFTLFIIIEKRLFCVIGGKGISVIKRFCNHSFGLDFYEKIADPENDIVHSQYSRGVSGNLTSEQQTYRNEQRLADALSLGRIPKKIHLQLRKELKDTVFDFIDFGDTENIYLEIGIAFCLKWKINFDQLCELIVKINEILDSPTSRPLSRFDRITDHLFIEDNLKSALLNHLRNDMVRLNTPDTIVGMLLDYDFVHPNKLSTFYECDEYKVFLKGAKSPFYSTKDRSKIYYNVLRHIYSIVDPSSDFEFKKTILGVRVRGYSGEHRMTEAMFINHLTCEISFNKKPHFLIDNHWYTVRGNFISEINQNCFQLISRNQLDPNPLNISWGDDLNEGDYNLLYEGSENIYVFDKILSQNIELCDLIYTTQNMTYLIHVKKGFDAKIRDLTNQVLISSSRLWNDLKSDKSFLKGIYKNYNKRSQYHSFKSWNDFLGLFENKEIAYVVAFTSSISNTTVTHNLIGHKSNIAKISLIQSFKDQIDNYQMKIIEISKSY